MGACHDMVARTLVSLSLFSSRDHTVNAGRPRSSGGLASELTLLGTEAPAGDLLWAPGPLENLRLSLLWNTSAMHLHGLNRMEKDNLIPVSVFGTEG